MTQVARYMLGNTANLILRGQWHWIITHGGKTEIGSTTKWMGFLQCNSPISKPIQTAQRNSPSSWIHSKPISTHFRLYGWCLWKGSLLIPALLTICGSYYMHPNTFYYHLAMLLQLCSWESLHPACAASPLTRTNLINYFFLVTE